MGGSSYKEELPTAKPDFTDSSTRCGGAHILISVHGGVDGFCLG